MTQPWMSWTYCAACWDPLAPGEGSWLVRESDGQIRYCSTRCVETMRVAP